MKYGLKLWSNNTDLFPAAMEACERGIFDFIELYSNPDLFNDEHELEALREIPITVHATHSHGFHEFLIGETQEKLWFKTLELADFCNAEVIVVHPGREHTIESFKENLAKIDDPRIHIENMAGLDIDSNPMFAQKLEDLEKIHAMKPICFDFEKAVKAACYQKLDYKAYIEEALQKLTPRYFHISGGDMGSAIDEHRDLNNTNFDISWIKKRLEALPDATMLVLETPKRNGIENDIANAEFFRALA